jgi:hypothetical protein
MFYSSHRKAWQLFAFKNGFNDFSFSFREDVCSHSESVISRVEKVLNTFYLYNRDCRVPRSERRNENLDPLKDEEGKTHGNN